MLENKKISEQDLHMVKKIAKIVAFKYLWGFENHDFEGLVTTEELYHQGIIGCIKAKKRYDPSTGNSFVKFAYMFIKGEIISLLRMKGALIHVPQEKYQQMRHLQKERETGKSDFDVAQNMGWEMDRVVNLEALKPKIVSTSSRPKGDDFSRDTLGDLLEFKGKSSESLLKEKEFLEIISNCIENIGRAESRFVLISRYKQEKTLAQLSADFNCSIETIRNRQAEAELSVKKCLKRNGVE